MTRVSRRYRVGIAAVSFPGLLAGGAAADPAQDAAVWAAMLSGCVAVAETGAPAAEWQATGVVTRACRQAAAGRLCDLEMRRWERQGGGALDILDPPQRRAEGVVTLCAPAAGAGPEGNDAAGLALRAVAHDLLEPGRDFLDEDQTGPADVWRGCAADGQGYRLASMTQTTRASFHVALSPRDPFCAVGTS